MTAGLGIHWNSPVITLTQPPESYCAIFSDDQQLTTSMAKTLEDTVPSASLQKRSTGELAKDLFILSRFNRYNPLLATFCGGELSRNQRWKDVG